MLKYSRYTVNADDFGKDKDVTAAIAESFAKGYINQTTLMVNMPSADEAVAIAKKAGFTAHIGLHLNLTEGQAMTAQMRQCPYFCDETGVFKGKFPPSRWSALPASLVSPVAAEIEAQCKAYLEFGLPLMHCDGHHHIQSWLPIARILFPILKKYGFNSVRRPNNAAHMSFHPQIQPRLRSIAWSLMASRHGFATTDVFCGWADWDRYGSNWPKKSRVEIMVHPGHDPSCGGWGVIDITDFRRNTGRQLELLLKSLPDKR